MDPAWRREAPLLVLLAAMFALAALSWAALPERLPVHWGPSGEPDRYGGRVEALLVPPVVAAALYGLLLLVEIAQGLDESSRRPYRLMRFALVAFVAAIYFVMNAVFRGVALPMVPVVSALLGALLVAIGRVLPQLRRGRLGGFGQGFQSERAWLHANRLVGRLFLACGLVLVAAALVGSLALFGLAIVGLVAGSFVVLVHVALSERRARLAEPPAH
jgi:uncharacterized membrane protein